MQKEFGGEDVSKQGTRAYHVPHFLMNNYAFIDGQNLHKGIKSLGWTLDYKRLRKYLSDKYDVAKAFIVMGYIASNTDLYTALQNYGFILIFKPILTYKDGTVKGNCDADLVLNTMIRLREFDQAVLVTGDGDYFCLVKYLKDEGKLKAVLVPEIKNYSALLKPFASGYLTSVSEQRAKLEYKKRAR
jgi:uncharacterized LabA/DUF88 family protein